MTLIEQKVLWARRRLVASLLLLWLAWGVLLAAGLCILATIGVRLLGLAVSGWQLAGVTATIGGLFTLVLTWLKRPTLLQAAVALDQAARLKERLSTALVVQGCGDPFAQAAVRDAEKWAGSVHVPAHLRLQAPALWPWSAAAMLSALLLLWLMPNLDLFGGQREEQPVVSRAAVEAERKFVKAELEARLDALRELARDNERLKDLAERLATLELPDKPPLTPEDVRREAVKRIDAVQEQLRRELADADHDPLKELKRMLRKLPPTSGEQAESRLARALADGDFEGAEQALDQMAEKIKEAALNANDPGARGELQRIQGELERLAEQITALDDDAQLQKELENTGGLSAEEARRLLDHLLKADPPKQGENVLQRCLGSRLSSDQIRRVASKVEQKRKARQACRKLASSLAKAAEFCAQCNNPAAAGHRARLACSALSEVGDMLSEMVLSEQALNDLEARLLDLENLRQSVCQGNWRGDRSNDRVSLQGLGVDRGSGARVGRERPPHKRDPIKASTRFQGGTIIGQMLIDGPQVRGEAMTEVMNVAASAVRDALDAIEREEVPYQYRQVVREYFESLAGLVRDQRPVPEKQSDGQ